MPAPNRPSSRLRNDSRWDQFRQSLAGRSAPLMFLVSLVFLVCQAVLVVTWVDMPDLQEAAQKRIESLAQAQRMIESDGGPADLTDASSFEYAATSMMLILWPLVILESCFHWLTRPWDREHRWFHFYSLLFGICPSLRMCARSPEMGNRLWLPGMGWRKPEKRLRRQLDRHFSVPMILIALLIMPVLIVEFFMQAQVARYAWLRVALHVGTGVIWFAFAAEFILMVSVAEKKIRYIKEHWIDLAIILLPFFSFLRSLQAIRGSRLASLARIPQLSKIARVYRLRGTAVKALRALILLDVAQRLLRTSPERRIVKMKEQAKALEKQARQLRVHIAKLDREIMENREETDAEAAVEAGDGD